MKRYLTYSLVVLSIFFAAVHPCWAHFCDGKHLLRRERRADTEMRAMIERHIEAIGFQLKGGLAPVVVDGWEITPMKVTQGNRALIERFLKKYAGPDYSLLNRYFTVRKDGELISIAIESTYLDWKIESYSNILVSEKWAEKFANANTAEIGYHIPFNHSVLPLLQSYHSERVYLHHYVGMRVADYPVPVFGQEDSFHDKPYIQFGRAYNGPNLIGNPYSARLLAEAAKFLDENPKKKSVLVLGSGIGYEAVHLLRICPDCTVDVSEIDEDALENTKLNIRANKLGGRTQAYLSDLFATIQNRYDLIVFAPPRVVTQEFLDRTRPERLSAHEWNAHVEKIKTDLNQYDYDGRLLRRTLKGYRDHLNLGGSLLIMSDDVELPRLASPDNRVRLLFQGGHWGGENKEQEGRFGIFSVQRPN